MSVYSLDNRSPEDIAESNDLLKWLVRMHERKSRFNSEGGSVSTRDFVLSPDCSGRFAVMVEEDGALALAAQPDDLRALAQATWASAAFARGVKGKDYLILNCKDLCDGKGPSGPVELRVFMEVSTAVADALATADPFPTRLRLRPMMLLGGIILHGKKEPRAEVPLVYRPVN